MVSVRDLVRREFTVDFSNVGSLLRADTRTQHARTLAE
jgi:hypothetical protein